MNAKAAQPVLSPDDFTPRRFAELQVDPFAIDPYAFELRDLPRKRLRGKKITVRLAIAIWRIQYRGQPSTQTLETGLRKLFRQHPDARIFELEPLDLSILQEQVRDWWEERRRERATAIARMPDGPEKDKALTAFFLSGRSDGVGAVENLITSTKSLGRLFTTDPWDPTGGVSTEARLTPKREALSEKELMYLYVFALEEKDSELALLVLDVLRETACRRMTLIGLNMEDIDFTTGVVQLRGKKTRRTKGLYEGRLSQDCLDRIETMAKERSGWTGTGMSNYNPKKPGADATPALVRLPKAGQTYGQRLSRRVLETMFNRFQLKLFAHGIRRNVSPHWIRHTTLTQAERVAGLPGEFAFSGHVPKKQGVEIALGYSKLTASEARAVFDVMFPPQTRPEADGPMSDAG